MSFQLSIVTPSGKAFDDLVDSVALPGSEGGLEVYSGHMPMVVALVDGKLKIRKAGVVQEFTTASGILEVMPDHNVLVLVDSAV